MPCYDLQGTCSFYSLWQLLSRPDVDVVSLERPRAACSLPFAYLALQIGATASIVAAFPYKTSLEHVTAQEDA